MTKANKIEYILKCQKEIDTNIIDDFQLYNKNELNEMSAKEVNIVFLELLDAENIMDNIYQTEYIKHGRSE